MDSISKTKRSRALAVELPAYERRAEDARALKQAMMQEVLNGRTPLV